MNKLVKPNLLMSRKIPGLENFANAFPTHATKWFLKAVT